ncbi:nucleotidyltransferase family protein [Halioglobus maricola]|uniref:Nucleotidyltransferase family protein n=1 Tax=Halioglobus maricola TaxID=2601894 RepID=A0A5P9NG11_9GAMM|nr:nucleotidyltransferase family protein [Halioglobus maricola]QFU74485.1 nucleotidyltransferase family protein [Halioglobus maricola]
MKAMILAAGFGERMRPLTEHTPKPLLQVAGVPLMEYHLRRLAAAGCNEIVVNVSHLADQIETYFGDGDRWGVNIAYSHEDEPLETAGGIQRALPLLGDEAFLVVNGDVWIDYPFEQLIDYQLKPWEQAHLVMVDNPPQHPLGDFCLDVEGRVSERPEPLAGYTYAGLAMFSPVFFAHLRPGKLALRPLLDQAIADGSLGAQYYGGEWADVGTPERLKELDKQVSSGVRSVQEQVE